MTVRQWASGCPEPAAQIADLLDHTAFILHNRETNWDLCQYSQTIQNDLTQAHFGREIAIAQALTDGDT